MCVLCTFLQIRSHISETTGAISFKFDMQGREYGPTKIYKFDRNRPNSFRATIG